MLIRDLGFRPSSPARRRRQGPVHSAAAAARDRTNGPHLTLVPLLLRATKLLLWPALRLDPVLHRKCWSEVRAGGEGSGREKAWPCRRSSIVAVALDALRVGCCRI